MEEFSLPTIALTYCDSERPGRADACATREETDNFLRRYPMFFVYQSTHFMVEMFSDHDYVSSYPHNGDKQDYFPTVSLMNSFDFGTVNANREAQEFELVELMMNYNDLTIQDDPFRFN